MILNSSYTDQVEIGNPFLPQFATIEFFRILVHRLEGQQNITQTNPMRYYFHTTNDSYPTCMFDFPLFVSNSNSPSDYIERLTTRYKFNSIYNPNKNIEFQCLLCMSTTENRYLRLNCSTKKSFHCLCEECFCNFYCGVRRIVECNEPLQCCYCKKLTDINQCNLLYSSEKEFEQKKGLNELIRNIKKRGKLSITGLIIKSQFLKISKSKNKSKLSRQFKIKKYYETQNKQKTRNSGIRFGKKIRR
jgi:hypothetical protein